VRNAQVETGKISNPAAAVQDLLNQSKQAPAPEQLRGGVATHLSKLLVNRPFFFEGMPIGNFIDSSE
jgi:hypothetical protein